MAEMVGGNGAAATHGDRGGQALTSGRTAAATPQAAPAPGISDGDRRLLAAMPLHAITVVHGENGLRERLTLEIQAFPEAKREQIGRALDLASRLHAHDRRQREPYINHLLRVAIRIITYYGVTDPDVICAALLHDSVEDHADGLSPGGGQAGALTEIARQFGQRVADLVAAVTNPEPEPGKDRHEQYREHVAAALETTPWARVIKASDFTDNGVGLIHTTGPKLGKLADKYAPLVPVLRDLIARPDTPLSDDAKAHILGQLNRAGGRFTAIQDQARTRSQPGGDRRLPGVIDVLEEDTAVEPAALSALPVSALPVSKHEQPIPLHAERGNQRVGYL